MSDLRESCKFQNDLSPSHSKSRPSCHAHHDSLIAVKRTTSKRMPQDIELSEDFTKVQYVQCPSYCTAHTDQFQVPCMAFLSSDLNPKSSLHAKLLTSAPRTKLRRGTPTSLFRGRDGCAAFPCIQPCAADVATDLGRTTGPATAMRRETQWPWIFLRKSI